MWKEFMHDVMYLCFQQDRSKDFVVLILDQGKSTKGDKAIHFKSSPSLPHCLLLSACSSEAIANKNHADIFLARYGGGRCRDLSLEGHQ